MKKYILLLGLLYLIPQLSIGQQWSFSEQWLQQGTTINGEAAFDDSGASISLSANGSRLAIGAPDNDGNGGNSGHVRIYEYNGVSWNQLGNDIDGEAPQDGFGSSVSLSADGNRLAVGGPHHNGNGMGSGHVRIYEYNGVNWIQLGMDIDGEAANDWSGYAVSLSNNGNRVAIGASRNDDNGMESGHVRVYEYDGVNWVQLGVDIDGEAADDRFGGAVSLSGEGNRLAVGAPYNDNNGNNSGHVRIYEYNGIDWVQLGIDIDGEAADDISGISVSLNNNGTIVAIGASHNDGNGNNSGHVRVYEYNGVDWMQLGMDIDGEAVWDVSGRRLDLNDDGTVIAIGGPDNDGNGGASGHVRIYQFDGVAWNQLDADIDGEVAGEQLGSSVSLSADGNIVAVGAPGNNANNSGHVRIYEFGLSPDWTKQGNDIDGEDAYNESGTSVSLSSDQTRVAIGAPGNNVNGNSSGHARIYEYDGVNWNQLGMDIDGEEIFDYSGRSVSLNSNGSRVAVGAYGNDNNGMNSGHVRVYEFNGLEWIQLGADIDGETISNLSGMAVSLDSDGNRVAVGAPGNDDNGNNAGQVRLYEFQDGSWIQLGADINGEASGDWFGRALYMSGDGTRVAVGAPYNDGNGDSSGHVRIYEYNGINWIQLGTDIDGEAAGDESGDAVSLNNDGSRLAIGAALNNGNGDDSGHTRIYEYNGVNWIQLGADIDGEAIFDYSGTSVSLSSDGNKVAIGARYNDGNGGQSGHVRVYEFDGLDWVQVSFDIDGEEVTDLSGFSVSLNRDGSAVAIGAISNNGNGESSGHVRIYAYPYTQIPDANFEQALIDQGIDSEGILDGRVFTPDISQITALGVSGEAIYDLTGIEDFTALEVLQCSNNRLTNLDVSNNVNLQELWCNYNRLSDLDVSSNPNLSVLSCPGNRITGLNLVANVNLSLLHCESNQLGQRLDLRNLPFLADVNTTDNSGLLCIQVDDQTAADAGAGIYSGWLKDPAAGYSGTCSLLYTPIPDANFEQALIDRGIDSEEVLDGQVLTSDVSGINFLIIPGENIADLTGIAGFSALEMLICNNNNLTTLDFSSNPYLTHLDCSNNQLTGINVSASDNLTEFYAGANQLSGSLILTGNPSLEELNVINNPLLSCIEITDPASANAGIGLYANWVKDITANYSESCGGVMAKGDIASAIKDIKDNIEEKETIQTIIVYPNPARDQLHITSDNEAAITHVVFYNLQGERVLISKTADINISALAEGLYFVAIRILNNESVVYRKIVVSKD